MSASGPGNMTGPRLRTPLLLLLLLLTTLTRTVFCQYEDDAGGEEPEVTEGEVVDDGGGDVVEDPQPDADGEIQPSDAPPTEPTDPAELPPDEDPSATVEPPIQEGSGSFSDFAEAPEEPGDTSSQDPSITDPTSASPLDQGLSLIIILIPVVLVVLIIAMIVCGIFINRRWNQKARNQELKKEDPYLDGSPTEKVPMPMFEEDVPSVLELEMEEFDQWMKKDEITHVVYNGSEGDTAEDSNIS